MNVTRLYGITHDVLLGAAANSQVAVRPQELRLLLAVAEQGGVVTGSSHTLVGLLGSNATAVRRAAVVLDAAGLITNASKRGVGMHLALTDEGGVLADKLLGRIVRRVAVETEAEREKLGERVTTHFVGSGEWTARLRDVIDRSGGSAEATLIAHEGDPHDFSIGADGVLVEVLVP